MTCLYTPMAVVMHVALAEFPQVALALWPNSTLRRYCCMACITTCSIISFGPVLCFRQRGLAFIMRHAQWVPLFGMVTSALSYCASTLSLVTSESVTQMTTSEAITQAVIHMMLRPLAGKVIVDLPVWWMTLVLMLQWIATYYLAPSLYTAYMNGIGVIGPCMAIYLTSMIWIEYSRRSQFLDLLRMYNYGADKQFKHMNLDVKIKHRLIQNDIQQIK